MFIKNKVVSLGGGQSSADVFSGGFFDYNDLATQTTPISVLASTPTVLTNDGGGAFTNKLYPPIGVTDVWNSTTNKFDFSQLKLGDMIDIRLDLNVTTTSPNQSVNIDLWLGIGSGGGEYPIAFSRSSPKNAADVKFNRFNGIYMGNTDTLNFPGEFRIESDSPCSVVVNGWYCKIIRRG